MKMQGTIEFTVTERSEERVVSEMPFQAGIKKPFGVVCTAVFGAGDKLMADVTTSHVLSK